jgi:hypothetical protein
LEQSDFDGEETIFKGNEIIISDHRKANDVEW